MKLWQSIRSGVAASVLAHVSVLGLVIFFAEVHPFGAVTAEPIAVDIVAPDEVPKKEEFTIPDSPFAKAGSPESAKDSSPQDKAAKDASPRKDASSKKDPPPNEAPPQESAKEAVAPQPQPSPKEPSPKEPSSKDAPKQSAQKPAEQKQAALTQAPQPDMQQATQQATPQPPPPSPFPAPIPAPIPQAPDISEKYHVMLGLPQGLSDNNFDAVASEKADIGDSVIVQFRQHLKSCLKLPGSISPSDPVTVKLRVFMEPDGRFAMDPMLVEGSGSAKGPVLMQSAMKALEACQPYNMLPANKYTEWRQMDIVFTPKDF